MRGLGFTLTIVGVIALIAAIMMDTTIATAAGARVSNVALMADRQLYTLIAGIVLVAGVLMVLFTGKGLSGKSDDDHQQ
jgi:uncharacterized membrane protein